MEEPSCLTFDCYGTLIDWDSGVQAAVEGTASLAGCDVGRLLEDREAADRALTAEGYQPYDEVLRTSLASAAVLQGRAVSGAEAESFAAGMGAWPPFPDSAAALARLADRFRLCILSNVGRETLLASVALLGVGFEVLVTADDLRSYKPRRAHFDEGLRRLGVAREAVLHVAASPYHDLAPAELLGWRTAWIDRRGEGEPSGCEPALRAASLSELADRLDA